MSTALAAIVESYPAVAQRRFAALRRLLYTTAHQRCDLGGVDEGLRWGEPAFLPRKPNRGTTLRVALKATTPEHLGVYFSCQSRMISTLRTLYPDFDYEGNRALLIPLSGRLPRKEISHCIALAFTYHSWKNTAMARA
ncbi:MAG: DUF1801 domain-containing protein [Pseudomonadota bacterium]